MKKISLNIIEHCWVVSGVVVAGLLEGMILVERLAVAFVLEFAVVG